MAGASPGAVNPLCLGWICPSPHHPLDRRMKFRVCAQVSPSWAIEIGPILWGHTEEGRRPPPPQPEGKEPGVLQDIETQGLCEHSRRQLNLTQLIESEP
jgi:hypothetical protein